MTQVTIAGAEDIDEAIKATSQALADTLKTAAALQAALDKLVRKRLTEAVLLESALERCKDGRS